MKKVLVLALAMVLAVCIGVGATLAYLFTSTESVVNTFEYGDINITLTESGTTYDSTDKVYEKTFKMIPGNTISKDPKVTVLANSEACYLFVMIEESDNYDDFLTYAIADGWKLYDSGEEGSSINTTTNNSYVIYREVDAATATSGVSYDVLAGDSKNVNGVVNVRTDVTKNQLNALDKGDAKNYPTITFTAHAVQKANLDLAGAYAQAFPTT